MRRWLRRTLGLSELGARIDERFAAIDEKFAALESKLDAWRARSQEPDQSVLQRMERFELQIGDVQVEISSLRADLARDMEALQEGQSTSKT